MAAIGCFVLLLVCDFSAAAGLRLPSDEFLRKSGLLDEQVSRLDALLMAWQSEYLKHFSSEKVGEYFSSLRAEMTPAAVSREMRGVIDRHLTGSEADALARGLSVPEIRAYEEWFPKNMIDALLFLDHPAERDRLAVLNAPDNRRKAVTRLLKKSGVLDFERRIMGDAFFLAFSGRNDVPKKEALLLEKLRLMRSSAGEEFWLDAFVAAALEKFSDEELRRIGAFFETPEGLRWAVARRAILEECDLALGDWRDRVMAQVAKEEGFEIENPLGLLQRQSRVAVIQSMIGSLNGVLSMYFADHNGNFPAHRKPIQFKLIPGMVPDLIESIPPAPAGGEYMYVGSTSGYYLFAQTGTGRFIVYNSEEGKIRTDVAVAPDSPPADMSQLARIDINTATPAELETIPGIGPAMARKIIDYRNVNGRFDTVDELDNVPGIGPALLERMRPYVYVVGIY